MNPNQVRVLVVDDTEAKRYTVVRQLQRYGFHVEEAVNGADALQAAQRLPDVIVLDVKLPDIDGREVCRRLKADPHTAPIPVLHLSSTFRTVEHRVEGLESGADAYLVDVSNPSELVATIRALVRARRAERALFEAEQRFLLLVNKVREYAIFTCDASGRIASWNEGVERVLGLKRDQFFERGFDEALSEPGLGVRVLDQARSEGSAVWEIWQAKENGGRVFITGNVTAVRDDAADLLGFTVVLRDSTEKELTEEAQRNLLEREHAARVEAERVNREKDEFLATLSHELRTPLMAIVLWTEMMKMGGMPAEELQEGVDSIYRNARALSQLIEDLLDVSRVISGKMSLHLEAMDLASAVEAGVAANHLQADAKQISLDVDLSEAKTSLEGDRSRLQQVFSNLISNAIKFSPDRTVITVRASRTEDAVSVSIADRGRGIQSHFLPQVFDRFRQEDASSTRSHAGLGLGLSIVRQLVELHGGGVKAESEGRDRGAKFTVTLPLRELASLPAPGDATNNSPAGSGAKPLAGLRVLLIEDDPDSRAALRQSLVSCGADVAIAESADAGFSQYLSYAPHVIVSDIGLPNEDGYSFIARVRAAEKNVSRQIPAIALTAFARPEDRQKTADAGFDLHVAKPTTPSDVVLAILAATGHRSS